MQTPKASKSSPSEQPKKISPRAVRQLKTNGLLEPDSASTSNRAVRAPKISSPTPKISSPKTLERRSPRSPVPELQKKRPSRGPDLENQITQLQEDLKQLKEQLTLSESLKKQAVQDAEGSKEQLLAVSSKLEESQRQLTELSSSPKIPEEQDPPLQSELNAIQNQHSAQTAALASAMDEIQQLKLQLGSIAESEVAQTRNAESSQAELKSLKENLAESILLVEDMKKQVRDCKESEARAQALVSETLLQLETAKNSVEALRMEGAKSMETYEAIAMELDQSKARVNLLEGLVDAESKSDREVNERTGKSIPYEAEIASLKAEVEQLRTALENAEIRHHEEQTKSTLQIRSAHELVEQIKLASSHNEAELMVAKADIEELKANLMDKETELQGVLEENEVLNMKLGKSLSCHGESEIERELKKSIEDVEDLKENLMDKETELQNILEENEVLKSEIKKRETDDVVVAEVDAAKAAEREAITKLGYITDEADKSNRRAAWAAEQLEAARIGNSEMEAELRKLKVQADQWRKAAEAAAAMLSAGGNNGSFDERQGQLDNGYNNPTSGRISSPYSEDADDDLMKKKNGNVLKKIGVLWKKQQK